MMCAPFSQKTQKKLTITIMMHTDTLPHLQDVCNMCPVQQRHSHQASKAGLQAAALAANSSSKKLTGCYSQNSPAAAAAAASSMVR
jgi:hypothetical protein